jgi:proton-dependent oligopeptide transporter, POT family
MTSTATAVAPPTGRDATWFGHPRGLFILFFTEMWERFSYYGMRSLLVLYMVDHLFIRPDVGQHVLGFAALKGALEHVFGPLDAQPLASQVYGLYTGFVYFTPFFGGLLADRVLGQRRSVVLGAALMAIGHFMMASEHMFLLALLCLIAGNGAFKPNIATQVGSLYPPGDPRRDRAFSIFYVGINVGAFLSPLVCGTLGQTVGWHWGFAAAGVGMVIGLVVFVTNQKRLVRQSLEAPPPVPVGRVARAIGIYVVAVAIGIPLLLWILGSMPPLVLRLMALAVAAVIVLWIVRLPREERPRVIAICVACATVAAFWAVYEQQGNTLQLWADRNTNWSLFGLTIPSTWFQAFNPFMIAAFTPLLTGFWARQAARGTEPTSLTKMAIGCVVLGLSFVVMIAATTGAAPDVKRSVLWLTGTAAIYTIGELYLSPIGLSFVTKVAPARIVSMMMGVWFLANFIGNYMTGYLGTFWEKVPHSRFFLLMTTIGVAAGGVLLLLGRPLNRIVAAHDRP